MSRTRIELESNDNEKISQIVDQIISSHGYEYTLYKGTDEQVWNQGIGMIKAPKYIKYYFEGNTLVLEGWVGNYGRESELKGFVASLPKKDVKKVLNEIEDNVNIFNQKNVYNNNLTDTTSNVDNNNKSASNSRNDNQDNHNTSSNSNDIIQQNINSNRELTTKNIKNKMIYYFISIIISIIILLGALSGSLVLRGTNSSGALALFIFLILVYEVYTLIKLYKQKQSVEEKTNNESIGAPPIKQEVTNKLNTSQDTLINKDKLIKQENIISQDNLIQKDTITQDINLTEEAFKIIKQEINK